MSKFSLFLVLALVTGLSYGEACSGRVLNPITDLNWNNSWPMTVGGVSSGNGPNNPPLHKMPAICRCSPKPGVGITYWEPRFVGEVARTAGCLSTLGGVDVMGGGSKFLSSENEMDSDSWGSARMQVHWYDYPVLKALDALGSYAGCVNIPDFKMDAPTEVDPLWNAEVGSALSSPESLLFANPIAALSCIPDALTSMINFPLDLLWWCAGSQGIVYPLNGRAQTYSDSVVDGNLHILEKYMARAHKIGKLLMTIGPAAQCSNMYSPTWLKSQYRFDQVFPIASNNSIVAGKPSIIWGNLSQTPIQTEQAFMVWRGRQCCVAPY